jgi:hypothetical protein
MQFLARIDRGLQTSAAPAPALDCAEEALDLRIEWRRLFQIDRMAGIGADPNPDPTLAATIALTFSGYRSANCKAAYPPMLERTRWARPILRQRITAVMSSTANSYPYKAACSGTSLGGYPLAL